MKYLGSKNTNVSDKPLVLEQKARQEPITNERSDDAAENCKNKVEEKKLADDVIGPDVDKAQPTLDEEPEKGHVSLLNATKAWVDTKIEAVIEKNLDDKPEK